MKGSFKKILKNKNIKHKNNNKTLSNIKKMTGGGYAEFSDDGYNWKRAHDYQQEHLLKAINF